MFMKWWRQLAKQFQEQLPGKRIYFIYTHDNRHDRFRHGLKANTELSYWGASALAKEFPRVSFLRFLNEKPKRINKITAQDVVIGHVGTTWMQAGERTRRLISFAPWCGHEDHSIAGRAACISQEAEMAYYDRAAAAILLTSEFNQRTYLDQPNNFWFPYFQRLRQKGVPIRVVHQPIDLALFPRLKTTYQTNDFLYIGNTNHMKCLPDSQKLVSAVGRTLHLYGTGERNLNHLDARAVAELPKIADFFIQPGMWEAQCVSILEAAARGFILLTSPDTGYPYDHPYLLRYGDFEYNLRKVKEVLALPAHERQLLGDTLHRRLVEDPRHNDWSALSQVLVEEVKRLYNNQLTV